VIELDRPERRHLTMEGASYSQNAYPTINPPSAPKVMQRVNDSPAVRLRELRR
jgi:hypothetical protein